MQLLERNKLQMCKDKVKYYKNIIYPKPRKLCIDIEYFPLEQTSFQVTNYKNIKKFIDKNKKRFGITTFNNQKYSFTGKFVDDDTQEHEDYYFKIHFYKLDSNKYIVEFQRRSGCLFTWRKHYKFIKSELEVNNLL